MTYNEIVNDEKFVNGQAKMVESLTITSGTITKMAIRNGLLVITTVNCRLRSVSNPEPVDRGSFTFAVSCESGLIHEEVLGRVIITIPYVGQLILTRRVS